MNTSRRILALFAVACLALVNATTQPDTIFHTTYDKILKTQRSRIIGGSLANTNEFPFQVGILSSDSTNPNENDGFCGGVLISKNMVVTAAHCVDTYQTHHVFLGSNNVMSGLQVRVSKKVLHPSFNLDALDYDIALLTLEFDVALGGSINVALLPRKSASAPSGTATVTGWGKTVDGDGTIVEELRKVNVPIVSNTECTAAYGAYYVNDRKVCVSSSGGSVGPCHGDSGSPLTTKSLNDFTAIGIVSFGSVDGCQSQYPFVFTRLSSYVDWIAANGGPAARP